MMFLKVILVAAFALACDTICVGTMHISMIESKLVYYSLGIIDEKLTVSDEKWLFDYGIDGTIHLPGTDKFLGIDDQGRFILVTQPHAGFLLLASPDSNCRSTLVYDGEAFFRLNNDNLISYAQDDRGVQILVTFEDIIQRC